MKYVLLALIVLLPGLTHAGSLQPLSAADVPGLLQPPAHGQRIIALWALDCAYCEPNLKALATLQHQHRDTIELVTVTTDSITQHAAIQTRLQAIGMGEFPARAYAEASPERINFLLDPTWGGETPRVLIIRADGSGVGISGELTPTQLRKILPDQSAR